MNTLEINKYLGGFSQFIGTYPKDLLPKIHGLPIGIVINTDSSYEPGEHWVSVYIDRNGLGEYFDSFGLPPLHKEITDFMHNNCPQGWLYNTITFQSIYSQTCGNYCVLYLSSKFKGMRFNDFTAIFNHTPNINDKLAKFLYKGQAWSNKTNTNR
jgi:hypothetical protein